MTNELSAQDRRLVHAKEIWIELFDMELRHDAERREFVERLTDLEQVALVSDAALFGQMNCGWYQYQAMHKGAAEARWRVRAREDDADAATPAATAESSR